jgi:hypothetical protein
MTGTGPTKLIIVSGAVIRCDDDGAVDSTEVGI